LSVQVRPAIWIEERIQDQRQRERGQRGLKVDGEDQRLSGLAAEPAARCGENQVQQKREGETGRKHANAAHPRRAVVPADPERREPHEAGEDGKIADPPNGSEERTDKAGHNQRYAGAKRQGCCEARVSGIGGVLPWAFRNG
jgi:hypothetical protein